MIWILIPCYDGAHTIADVVRAAKATGHSVLVVDDGSSDGSAELARRAGADEVLVHPVNFGKGAALSTGFAFARAASAEAVVTLDADGQHDPAEIATLVAAHAQHPRALVIGVRSFDPKDMPRRSRIGNRISTWWISRFAGRMHRDTQSGFRLYPRGLYDVVQLKSRRFETESELLLLAAKMRVPLFEVTIKTIYTVGHMSHFRGFEDTLRVLGLVLSSPLWRIP